jgi:hypothetical protein
MMTPKEMKDLIVAYLGREWGWQTKGARMIGQERQYMNDLYHGRRPITKTTELLIRLTFK